MFCVNSFFPKKVEKSSVLVTMPYFVSIPVVFFAKRLDAIIYRIRRDNRFTPLQLPDASFESRRKSAC